MVTLRDGKPIVKVIDFGVSKALNQKLTEKTLFTAYGQMIGTPQYMSPEQAEMSELDIDTRSDVYSLGVLLYELLTGSTPLTSEKIQRAGLAELQRLIKEEDAQRLSDRVSTLGERLSVVADNRGIEPGRLRKLLRGELDWIVLRALEKERDRRYGSASSLSSDVQRYLTGQSVKACPPSLLYQISKFYRRNRLATIATVGIVASLVIGSTLATWGMFRARQERDQTQRQLDRAERFSDLVLEIGSTITAEDYTVQQMWRDLQQRLPDVFKDAPQDEAAIRMRIGWGQTIEEGEKNMLRAIELLEQPGGDPRALVRALTGLGTKYRWNGRFELGKRMCQRAVEVADSSGDPGSISGANFSLAFFLPDDEKVARLNAGYAALRGKDLPLRKAFLDYAMSEHWLYRGEIEMFDDAMKRARSASTVYGNIDKQERANWHRRHVPRSQEYSGLAGALARRHRNRIRPVSTMCSKPRKGNRVDVTEKRTCSPHCYSREGTRKPWTSSTSAWREPIPTRISCRSNCTMPWRCLTFTSEMKLQQRTGYANCRVFPSRISSS